MHNDVLEQSLSLLSGTLTSLLTCPNSDTLLCYCNDPFLTVCNCSASAQVLDPCHFDASVVWSGTEERAQISASTVVAFVTSEAIQVATKVIKECSKGLVRVHSILLVTVAQ